MNEPVIQNLTAYEKLEEQVDLPERARQRLLNEPPLLGCIRLTDFVTSPKMQILTASILDKKDKDSADFEDALQLLRFGARLQDPDLPDINPISYSEPLEFNAEADSQVKDLMLTPFQSNTLERLVVSLASQVSGIEIVIRWIKKQTLSTINNTIRERKQLPDSYMLYDTIATLCEAGHLDNGYRSLKIESVARFLQKSQTEQFTKEDIAKLTLILSNSTNTLITEPDISGQGSLNATQVPLSVSQELISNLLTMLINTQTQNPITTKCKNFAMTAYPLKRILPAIPGYLQAHPAVMQLEGIATNYLKQNINPSQLQ